MIAGAAGAAGVGACDWLAAKVSQHNITNVTITVYDATCAIDSSRRIKRRLRRS